MGVDSEGGFPTNASKDFEVAEPNNGLESPRFLQAVDRVADYFRSVSDQHAELSHAAQHFDFVLQTDSLAVVREPAATSLRRLIDESNAPEAITGIYADLYDEVINEELNRGK